MMVPIHALQWYRFADTVNKQTKLEIKVRNKRIKGAGLIEQNVEGALEIAPSTFNLLLFSEMSE